TAEGYIAEQSPLSKARRYNERTARMASRERKRPESSGRLRSRLALFITWSFMSHGVFHFVDRVELYVKGGDGGNGCRSFRREKYVPKGGPDGGDGGHGGSIIVRAIAGTDSLADIVNRKHWRGERGDHGSGAN